VLQGPLAVACIPHDLGTLLVSGDEGTACALNIQISRSCCYVVLRYDLLCSCVSWLLFFASSPAGQFCFQTLVKSLEGRSVVGLTNGTVTA
jgi:hypothetical protein